MKRIIFSTTLALAATPFVVHGQDSTDNPNRFFFGPRFGLNFKADFHSDSSYFNGVNPGLPTGGDMDRTYNDGYVLVDSSGNAGHLTRYWGYQNPDQVVGGTVSMQFHAIESSSPSSATDNPQYGAELVYQRVMGHLPFLSSGCWGLETGFSFTELDLRDNRNGTALVTTDTYSLNGVTPPSAGYNGPFSGSGALLGDTPTRTTESATMISNQKLSGQLFGFRVGPFAELNLTSQLALDASVGLTLAPAFVDYDFSETGTLAGGDSFAASGHSSKAKLLYGPYVGGMLRYAFNKNWGVYVGAQFQNLTDMEQSVGGRTARLDPGATVYGTVGASYSF